MDDQATATLTREEAAAPDGAPRATGVDALWLFSLLWAASVVFHVLGNPTFAWGPWQVVLGVAVSLVVLRPGRLLPGCVLGAALAVSIWSEAPVLGNQWLLSGMLGLAWTGSALAARPWRHGDVAGRMAANALPVVRFTTLAFYGWAAFNKLNSGFVRPATSCASFYVAESARSIGLGSLGIGEGWSAWLAIGATIACEGTVFTLLVVRRTRPLGAALGLLFHFTLAVDRTHQFADFSSILVACFTVFLPAAFARDVRRRVRAAVGRGPLPTTLLRGATCAVVLAVCVAAATTVDRPDRAHRLRLMAVDAWLVYGALTTTAVLVWLVRNRAGILGPDRSPTLRPATAWLLALPAIALLNGFTPYVGLKTATGWNMYANLVTVGGTSNHWVLRAAPDLGGTDAEPVRILASDDPALRWYVLNGYLLPRRTLQAYLSRHPSVGLTYEVGGMTHRLARAADDPDMVRAVPLVVEKLLPLRAVDGEGGDHPRCQDVWGPAL